MKCEGLLIYNLILAEFHVCPSSGTHWAENRADVLAHFAPGLQSGVLSVFERNTIFHLQLVIHTFMLSAGETSFFSLQTRLCENE